MTRRTPLATALAVAALVAGAAGLAGCSSGPGTITLQNGQVLPAAQRPAAPAITGTAVGGQPVDLAALRGHVVVVNVFGSWCVPCQEEAAGLKQVADETAPQGVRFVALAERDTAGGVQDFQREHGTTWPTLLDDDGSRVAGFARLPAPAPPTTYVLDRQGRVAARWIGGVLLTQLRPLVQQVLAEQGTA